MAKKSSETSFGEKLKALRQAKGWTQMELAVKAGLQQTHIAKLESAGGSLKWETVQALCDALGVSCEEFRK